MTICTTYARLFALLVVLGAAGSARADFIINGGFEKDSFKNWNLSGSTKNTGVATTGGPGIGYAYSGSYYAYLGPLTLGYLSETFTDPNPGETLSITMYLASDGSTPNEFEVMFNGATLFELQNIPVQGYTELSFTVTSAASNTLTLGFENQLGWLSLDDVSVIPDNVMPTPAPPSAIMLAMGSICLVGFRLRRR